MYKLRPFRWLAVAAILASPLIGAAQSNEPFTSRLPPEVRALLIQEMQAILQSSQLVLDALVRGEHALNEQQAQLIHDSFILAQELTPAGHAALEAAAPPGFLALDQAFHELSARLADAARQRDSAAEQTIFAEMQQACIVCHAEHVADRFPGLAP